MLGRWPPPRRSGCKNMIMRISILGTERRYGLHASRSFPLPGSRFHNLVHAQDHLRGLGGTDEGLHTNPTRVSSIRPHAPRR